MAVSSGRFVSLCSSFSRAQLFKIPWLLCPWDSPGKNTGVGGRSLLQGLFPAQGSQLGLSRCRQILYHLSHEGSPEVSAGMAWKAGSLGVQKNHPPPGKWGDTKNLT